MEEQAQKREREIEELERAAYEREMMGLLSSLKRKDEIQQPNTSSQKTVAKQYGTQEPKRFIPVHKPNAARFRDSYNRKDFFMLSICMDLSVQALNSCVLTQDNSVFWARFQTGEHVDFKDSTRTKLPDQCKSIKLDQFGRCWSLCTNEDNLCSSLLVLTDKGIKGSAVAADRDCWLGKEGKAWQWMSALKDRVWID